jgi:hypothetical protein
MLKRRMWLRDAPAIGSPGRVMNERMAAMVSAS